MTTPATPPSGGLPLPFALVSFADHWSRACAQFWSQMSRVDDPVQVVHAEEVLGVELMRDSVQAWIDLYATPLRIWTGALAGPMVDRKPAEA